MKLQGRNLSLQMSGEDVKLLHQELQQLGYTIDKTEVSQNYFGQSTDKIVKTFQKSENLKITGVVEKETAKLINLKVDAQQPQNYLVRGYVTQSDGTTTAALVAANIRIFDWDIRSENFLGETTTNANGYYQVTYTEEQFRKSKNEEGGADLIVRVYNSQGQLLATSPRKNNAQPEENIDLTVTVLGQPSPQDDVFVVKGTVNHANGTILSNITVQVFDKDMRSQQLLTAPQTNNEGDFEGTYTRAQFTRAEKANADLIFELRDSNEQIIQDFTATDDAGNPLQTIPVKDAEGNSTNIPIWFNAPAIAIVNFSVTDTRYQGTSEFTRYLEETSRIAANIPPDEWTEEDIAFLSNELEIPLQYLTFLRDAHYLPIFLETELPAIFFYGLFRQGLSTNHIQLLREKPSRMRSAVQDSSNRNIIPTVSEGQLEEWMVQFSELAVQQSFQPSEPTEQPSLGQIVSTAALNSDIQRQFVSFALAYEDDDNLLLDKFQEQLGSEGEQIRNELQFTLASNSLVYQHLPTLQAIGQVKQQQGWTASRDLARFNQDDWLGLVEQSTNYGTALPVDFETKEDFANAIAQQVEKVFPTAVVANRLSVDQELGTNDLNIFFEFNQDFHLGQTQIDSFLENGANLSQIADIPQLKSDLKGLQRVFRIVPETNRYLGMRNLLRQGFNSSLSIVNQGKPAFANTMTPVMGEAWVDNTFTNARLRVDAANLVGLKIGDHLSLPLPFIPHLRFPEPEADIPNLRELFGSLNGCECRHCRSVYSPAAYMVDLLQFLYRASEDGVSNRLNVLLQRRPDLQYILLNCRNANTVLPYIDLVNEVLEAAVSPIPLPGEDATEEEYQSWLAQYQTGLNLDIPADKLEARLKAMPEHEHTSAYRILNEAEFPWSLPFNLAQEKIKLFSEHLGIKLYQIQELFERDRDELTRSYLHLSEQEWELITTSTKELATLAPKWGEDNEEDLRSLLDAPWEVPDFLRRTGLSYEQLQEFVTTHFLSESGASIVTINLRDEGDRCNIDDYILNELNATILDKIHRFLRLRVKLGWTIEEFRSSSASLQWDRYHP